MDCPRYDERNPRATHEANDLVAYSIAAFSAYEQDRLQEFGSLPILAAIERFYDREARKVAVQSKTIRNRSTV